MEETAVPRQVSALKKSVYSSSVPISLPMGAKTAHSWEDDDDDNVRIQLSNISVLIHVSDVN